MNGRTMADAVRAVLVKRAFVPGDPSMAGGGAMPPGGDPAAAGAMPPGADPSMAGALPPGADPAAAGADPAAAGAMPVDPMAGVPGGAPVPEAGGSPASGMINMTADEFTKFIKQMMQAFGQGGAAPQQAQPDISAKLDTLIAVLQGQAKPAVPAVTGA